MGCEPPEHRDRRFQIFISSTFEDLQEERKKAVEVVVDRGHIPVALERFSASNDTDLEVIEKAIKSCQVYLLILGHRYGEVVRGRKRSYVQLEYDLACKHGLLILPFILRDDEIERRRKRLRPQASRDNAERRNYDKLCKFHEKVKRMFYQPWGPGDDFRYLVGKALDDRLRTCEKRGLIWELDKQIDTAVLRNTFIFDIVEELTSFRQLDARCSVEAEKKRAAASFFAEAFSDLLLSRRVALFFESGSTLAHVARELSGPLSEAMKIEADGRPSIQISTNNFLVYLHLWLRARVPCTLFPWGPPEDKFGASFGNLVEKHPQSPRYDLKGLSTDEEKEIEKARHPLTQERSPGLLLCSTSGLQLSKNHRVVFRPEDRSGLTATERRRIEIQVGKCYGPHVGSYHNKLFKRLLFDAGIPLVLFLTEDKIDCEIVVGKCHFVLDGRLSWSDFCSQRPVAFCVGCTHRNADKYDRFFRELGMEVTRGRSYSPATAIIARNREFAKTF